MSALAVVAERHDLMRKLLPNLNEGAESGCHEAAQVLLPFLLAIEIQERLRTSLPP